MPVLLGLALITISLGVVGIAVLYPRVGGNSTTGTPQATPWLQDGFDFFLVGLAVASLLLMVLVVLDLFSLSAIAGALALAAVVSFAVRRRAAALPRMSSNRVLAYLAEFLVIGGAAFACFTAMPPLEAKLHASDASVYLGAATQLAHAGGLSIDDPLVAEMAPAERRRLFAGDLARTDRAATYYHRFPGGIQLLDPDGATVSFNFYHLWPAWLAVGVVTVGDPGFLCILSFLSAVSLISLFLLGRMLAGPAFGALCALLLALSFPQIYFSRMPLSEIPAQAFFLSGLYCFLRALQGSGPERRAFSLLAAALWGSACLTRADGALFLFPSLTLVFAISPKLRSSVAEWMPAAVLLLSLAALAVLHQLAGNSYEIPILDWTSARYYVQGPVHWVRTHEEAAALLWLAAAGTAFAGACGKGPQSLRTGVKVLAGAALVSGTLAWGILFTSLVESEEIVTHLRWLNVYLPGPVAAGVVIGVALFAAAVALQRDSRTLGAPLLVFLAVPLVSLLIHPMVSQVQPWAIRRFVPMALPLLLTLALLGWRLGLAAALRKVGVANDQLYLLPAAMAVGHLAPQSAFLWREPLYENVGAQVKALSSRIPDNALVVLPIGHGGSDLQLPLQYSERRATLMVPSEGEQVARHGPAFNSYLERQLAAKKRVIALLHAPPSTGFLPGTKLGLMHLFSGQIGFREIPQSDEFELPRTIARIAIPYHAFEVRPAGEPPAARIKREEMLAQLSKGIDLSLPILPRAVAEATGISHGEPWGRWTDGPVATFHFPHPLPGRLALEIDVAQVYPPDRDPSLKIRVGSETKEVKLPGARGTAHVEFASPETANSLEIHIPQPASPKSRGESPDERLLGLGMKAIRIAATSAESRGDRMMRGLQDGVDFSAKELPPFIVSAEGLSHPEAAGRWTDGAIARIRFAAPLPAKFTLELWVAHVFGPNRGRPIRVAVGEVKREFTLDSDNETVRLDFNLSQPRDTIEIRLPKATSPAELGGSTDARRLGIRLKEMRIVPAPPG